VFAARLEYGRAFARADHVPSAHDEPAHGKSVPDLVAPATKSREHREVKPNLGGIKRVTPPDDHPRVR
jgi:hypothetical protein